MDLRASWHATALHIGMAALAVLLLGAAPADAQGDGGNGLQARYEAMKPALARSPFQRALLLESGPSGGTPQGDVYAVVEFPFDAVSAALQRAEHWCDMLILPFNVKRCLSTDGPPRQQLQLAVGRKSEQPLSEAHQLVFDYAVRAAEAGYLAVQMTAEDGPLGTRDYRLSLEAVPAGAGRTFVHMSYAYANGVAAQLATRAYLATVGRGKVGFSLAGRGGDGRPVHVGGIQGVAERNTMRYFLAMEAYLKSLSAPAERQVEQRLQAWFAATERYPEQLREMAREDYLVMKRKEVQAQQAARKG